MTGYVPRCPCGIPRDREAFYGEQVPKGREHRHGQERGSRSGAGLADRVARTREPVELAHSESIDGWGDQVVSGNRHRVGPEGGGRPAGGPVRRCYLHDLSNGR